MKLIYAALLLHSAGKKIDENGIKNILNAAGIESDEAQIKALVANISSLNIDEILKNATFAQITPAGGEAKAEEKKEEKKEEKAEEKAEEAVAGLSALFG